MPKYLFFIIIFILSICICDLANTEEKYKDITVSVVVNSTFKVSADSVPIDFGVVDPSKPVELYPERYFNEVRCASNNGRTWYLKAHCENLTGPSATISKSHFKIKVYRATGKGYYTPDWIPFGDTPVLVYTSSPQDTEGAETKIQFKYKLEPPPGLPSGNYSAVVTYTMTESP